MDRRLQTEFQGPDFDALLEESLPEQPPEEVIWEVTPWRRAMRRILIGTALQTITFQLWGLSYLLPVLGQILLQLGYRALRRGERMVSLFLGSGAAAERGAGQCVVCPRHHLQRLHHCRAGVLRLAGAGQASAAGPLLCALGRTAGRGTQGRGAGSRPQRPGAGGPVRAAGPSGAAGLQRLEAGADPAAVYGAILWNLRKIAGVLDEAGYCVTPCPVRLSDRALAGLLAGAMALLLAGGYLFAAQYPMDWSARPPRCLRPRRRCGAVSWTWASRRMSFRTSQRRTSWPARRLCGSSHFPRAAGRKMRWMPCRWCSLPAWPWSWRGSRRAGGSSTTSGGWSNPAATARRRSSS